MMMVLGLYVVMLRTVPYQELQYQRSWRHAANSRVNRRPSTQFLGPDNDMLTLSGVLMPEITGGRLSLLPEVLPLPESGAVSWESASSRAFNVALNQVFCASLKAL